jgi:PAS domain S-box-containing protein
MDLSILQFVPDAVIVCDRSGKITYANQTIQALFGYEPAELIGKPLGVLLPERYRQRHAIDFESYFTSPRARPMGLGIELVGLKKDGHEIPVDISLAPLQVGSDSFAIAAVRDITERRKFEEHERQLKVAQAEIRHRDEVLAIASHELRTPMGSLQLQARMLGRVAQETASELREIHERTGTAAGELNAIRGRIGKLEGYSQRLVRLIGQLLDSAHVHYSEMQLRLEDTDLRELTREAITGLREEIERTGSRVTIQAAEPVPGRWDPIRIEQVIANLILNAAKFGQGKPIRVTVDSDQDIARFAVQDRGVGIAPGDQQRIFEQFERAVAAGAALGLGLGLYITRQIVLAHGGVINVQSAPGVGSTFTVELPREGRTAQT